MTFWDWFWIVNAIVTLATLPACWRFGRDMARKRKNLRTPLQRQPHRVPIVWNKSEYEKGE